MAKSGVRRRIFLKKMASRRHCTEDEEKQKTGKRQKQKTRVGETKVWCFFKNEREKGEEEEMRSGSVAYPFQHSRCWSR